VCPDRGHGQNVCSFSSGSVIERLFDCQAFAINFGERRAS
jgi:hypothetical protein